MRPDDFLDQTLLGFSKDDPFTVRDSFEGVQIFGGIGSGKTSGSGALFARSYLTAGYGGLVLTAKVDETDLWRRYARETGREADLIIIGPEAANRFNFLDYEEHHPDADEGLTENIVRLFETISASVQNAGGDINLGDQFWRNEYRKLLRNAVDLLCFGGRRITLDNIRKVIMSAPQSLEQETDTDWQETSLCHELMSYVKDLSDSGALNDEQVHDSELTRAFWTEEFPIQHEKTRSTVISSFTGMCDMFQRGVIRRVFGTDTNITPEASFEGKIIILDFPEKRFHETGVAAQVLFKYCWQRAVEKRRLDEHPLPVFLWMDESQLFVNKHDVSFQTTSRSARVATVLLTQNLPNYYAALGGEKASKSLVDSLLGNLATKIFHNNTCAVTNQYAADLFAKDWQSVPSHGMSNTDDKTTFSRNTSEHLEYTILPRDFTNLATGGPKNNFIAEGIVHQGGRVFNCSGLNALCSTFKQTSNP